MRARDRWLEVDGADWNVYERPIGPDPRPALVFEASDKVRVIRVYPSNWRALSDGDLFALSLHA